MLIWPPPHNSKKARKKAFKTEAGSVLEKWTDEKEKAETLRWLLAVCC